MAKATTLQGNFNAGELSSLLMGRTDSPRYKQGLDTAINYLPTLQGPLVRRPGTKFMNAVKDSTKPPVLIPFQFSITQAYVLEFGDGYIRFYANNGQIVTSGTLYSVTGNFSVNNGLLTTPAVQFTATRSSLNPLDHEWISSSASITPGSILELVSPYAYADLQKLKWTQSADTLYLVHPNYPPFKLQRYAQQEWTIKQIYFNDGPYLPLNSYATLSDMGNVTLGAVNTNSPISQVVAGPTATVTGMITDPGGSGQIQVTTSAAHGFQQGQKVFIAAVVGTTEANNANPATATYLSQPFYWTIKVTSTTTFLLVGSTFVHAWTSGGTVWPALFWNNANSGAQYDDQRNIALIMGGKRYYGVIIGPQTPNYYGNAAQVYVMLQPFSNPVPFPSATVATAWQLGVWNKAFGYPSCVTFHQNRLVFSGSTNYPQEVDFSYVGQYENFAPSDATTLSVTGANAMQFNLASAEANPIQWMKSTAQALLAGSASAEWAMTPASTSDALTATNFNAQQTSFYGSANADAVGMGNSVLYIQRAQRKVRELHYFFQVGTFRSTDLTELSEHITNPGITKIAVQKETQPLLWAIRSDGVLLSMLYNRDDASIQAGWTRHYLGGTSDSSGTWPLVTSMAIIPSTDLTFDQLWVVVKRWINGATTYSIEYMTKIFDDLANQDDAVQGDCVGTYDVPITISGITTANPAIVTATAHGFSNGQRILIDEVNGLNLTTTDINGNTTITNLVNEKSFLVANATTNTFTLTTFEGVAISSVGYGGYVSGGTVHAMVTTISGLTWLKNETVGVLTDGGIHPDVVVSNAGAITLTYPAAKVQIGYRFNSDGKLLRVEGGAADGSSIGKTRRTTRAAFQMHRLGDISIGTDFTKLIPIALPVADNQQADVATPLYSGIRREGLQSAYDFESQICFRQNSMLPGSIQSITSFMEEQDV